MAILSKNCKVCGNKNIIPFFSASAPIANNVLCYSSEEALRFKVGKLELVKCKKCGFVWNNSYDGFLLSYSQKYENNQFLSLAFKEHIKEVVDNLPFSDKNIQILEVGCGQGYFLNEISKFLGERLACGIGIDPSLRSVDACGPLKFICSTLEDVILPDNFYPDMVICRHVIEHIKEPRIFLKNILDKCLSNTILVFETPSLEWIVEYKAFYDLYYEHCSLFSKNSLTQLLLQSEFNNVYIKSLFGGQYLLAIATRNEIVKRERERERERENGSLLQSIKTMEEKLDRLKNKFGPIALWGGASKSVALAHYFYKKINFNCCVDINPHKQGCYLPVSGVPILAPEDIHLRNIGVFIVVNPNYLNEVKTLCDKLKLKATCITLADL